MWKNEIRKVALQSCERNRENAHLSRFSTGLETALKRDCFTADLHAKGKEPPCNGVPQVN